MSTAAAAALECTERPGDVPARAASPPASLALVAGARRLLIRIPFVERVRFLRALLIDDGVMPRGTILLVPVPPVRTCGPRLAPRQQQILDFIEAFFAANECAPTVGEIARAFQFRSVKTAREHLDALERAGVLDRGHGRARGLRLTPREDA